MQNIVWKISLIVLILGLCAWSILAKELRLGKDLRGGVSLIYEVQFPEGIPATERADILDQVILVLKDRVNPQGIFDISMNPMGADRIEIVMPLPSETVQDLKKAYEDELNTLAGQAVISAAALDRAIADDAVLDRFGADPTTTRGAAAGALDRAVKGLEQAKAALAEVEARGEEVEQAELSDHIQAVADAEVDLEEARTRLLGVSLDRARVLRVLRLPNEPRNQKDENGKIVRDAQGNPKKLPSQRQEALDRLKAEFSHLATQLDALVEAFDTYQSERKGFDDPEDLMRLLRGAGVLEFRIAVRAQQPEGVNPADLRQQLQERGPTATDTSVAQWFEINDLKQWYDTPEDLAALESDPVGFFEQRNLVADERDGQYYMLLYNLPTKKMTHEGQKSWSVKRTFRNIDRLGRPAVSFELDSPGGSMMGRMTGQHVGQPMAIVLDGQVYSAPTLQSQISGSGIITGQFTEAEISYLVKVLAAGALEARLSPAPIAMNTIGPSIGADNLHRGLGACLIAVIAVAAFMLLYYFGAGAVADFALLANGLIIFGVMMGMDAAFTLPGLAGLVLTIGMAVDANVLIYERVREEIFAGEYELRGAIREGYRKALSTIIDANVTNLIVCGVLGYTATAEVKGFAVTLAIGICATLFTALFVTRQFYYLYTDWLRIGKLSMLPTVVPAIHRALEPNINWIGLRRVFWVFSGLAVAGSIFLVLERGVEMFDTEFRGGVAATMTTRLLDPANPDAGHLLLRQDDVRARIQALADHVDRAAIPDPATFPDPDTAGSEEERVRLEAERQRLDDLRAHQLTRLEFGNALVLILGETRKDEEGLTVGYQFQVKVPNPKELGDDSRVVKVVVEELVGAFGEELNVAPALDFEDAGSPNYTEHTHQIRSPVLGENLPGYAGIREDVSEFLGGVAVLLRNVEPPTTVEDVRNRIDAMRQQPDFSDTTGRRMAVFGLTPADGQGAGARYRDFAVTVFQGELNYNRPDVDFDAVETRLAKREWELASEALRRQSSLEQVSNFSSAVAQTLSANATVAVVLSLLGILVYIWVRFGSFRYSIAAIIALLHDVTIALGLLAVTGIIGKTAVGETLLIEEYRIDLGVVAALLTIIGYSLNDTIVILDRIRENRGKLPIPTAEIVNQSINQTVSRTLLTSVTTLIAVAIMYAEGGTGIRPFTFCLLTGLVVGTYSSVAIAAPLVFHGHAKGPGEASPATLDAGPEAAGS